MFIPSFSPEGKNTLLFRRMDGRFEDLHPLEANFIPGDHILPLGAKLKTGQSSGLLISNGQQNCINSYICTFGDQFCAASLCFRLRCLRNSDRGIRGMMVRGLPGRPNHSLGPEVVSKKKMFFIIQ
jgi:hypothetical protein